MGAVIVAATLAAIWALSSSAFIAVSAAQTAPAAPASAASLTLEFDVPADFSARAPDGGYRIRAMQAGYFGPGSQLLRTVEIQRDDIRVSGRTAQMTIPLFPLPSGSNRVSIKLRGMSSGRPGEWSQAVGPVTMPELATSARRDRRASPRARTLSARELDTRPALREALTPLLDADFSEMDVLASFGRVQDLAAAIVISRGQKLPLPLLSQAVKGPPAMSLVEAVRKLRPSLDAQKTVRAAQLEARSLLARPRRGSGPGQR